MLRDEPGSYAGSKLFQRALILCSSADLVRLDCKALECVFQMGLDCSAEVSGSTV
ncbi:hypothetical protein CEV32_3037 [Brucella rhizosphaerae]|uniref:Uncharacterized protein n=1 Tax=Brucella rhizosphaerae TaxID=571254 RepID=A0A256FV99_9HYPH|nr:hypothetical protein CEV32_3037 [Brucella rhizosphaerae]